VSTVNWLFGAGRARFLARFPEARNMVTVLDLSLMAGRDPAVRAVVVEAMKALKPRIAKSVVVPPIKANPLYFRSLQTAVHLLRVFGVHVELARSLQPALAALGLTSAAVKPSIPP
jgi:hypothetical protein